MAIDTPVWPFVPAKYFTEVLKTTPRKVRLLVVHDMEFPEKVSAAEDIARYFQNPDGKQSSHINVDCDTIVQCVWDSNVANAAPGANHDGIQMELAGFGAQNLAQWLDRYGVCLLANAADAAAWYCLKYGLPAKKLSVAEVKDGVTKGICGHWDVSRAFGRSDHSDPGPNFPWNFFIRSVQNFIDVRQGR